MSIRHPIPPEDFGSVLKHRGWLLFCPVYIGDLDAPSPLVVERNGVPEWLMTAAEYFEQVRIHLLELLAPGRDHDYLLIVTGPLEASSSSPILGAAPKDAADPRAGSGLG